tara:strand:+ start:6742 stop:10278 length:3537 start_codon:yes stop_codon:yes gene_type:complete
MNKMDIHDIYQEANTTEDKKRAYVRKAIGKTNYDLSAIFKMKEINHSSEYVIIIENTQPYILRRRPPFYDKTFEERAAGNLFFFNFDRLENIIDLQEEKKKMVIPIVQKEGNYYTFEKSSVLFVTPLNTGKYDIAYFDANMLDEHEITKSLKESYLSLDLGVCIGKNINKKLKSCLEDRCIQRSTKYEHLSKGDFRLKIKGVMSLFSDNVKPTTIDLAQYLEHEHSMPRTNSNGVFVDCNVNQAVCDTAMEKMEFNLTISTRNDTGFAMVVPFNNGQIKQLDENPIAQEKIKTVCGEDFDFTKLRVKKDHFTVVSRMIAGKMYVFYFIDVSENQLIAEAVEGCINLVDSHNLHLKEENEEIQRYRINYLYVPVGLLSKEGGYRRLHSIVQNRKLCTFKNLYVLFKEGDATTIDEMNEFHVETTKDLDKFMEVLPESDSDDSTSQLDAIKNKQIHYKDLLKDLQIRLNGAKIEKIIREVSIEVSAHYNKYLAFLEKFMQTYKPTGSGSPDKVSIRMFNEVYDQAPYFEELTKNREYQDMMGMKNFTTEEWITKESTHVKLAMMINDMHMFQNHFPNAQKRYSDIMKTNYDKYKEALQVDSLRKFAAIFGREEDLLLEMQKDTDNNIIQYARDYYDSSSRNLFEVYYYFGYIRERPGFGPYRPAPIWRFQLAYDLKENREGPLRLSTFESERFGDELFARERTESAVVTDRSVTDRRDWSTKKHGFVPWRKNDKKVQFPITTDPDEGLTENVLHNRYESYGGGLKSYDYDEDTPESKLGMFYKRGWPDSRGYCSELYKGQFAMDVENFKIRWLKTLTNDQLRDLRKFIVETAPKIARGPGSKMYNFLGRKTTVAYDNNLLDDRRIREGFDLCAEDIRHVYFLCARKRAFGILSFEATKTGFHRKLNQSASNATIFRSLNMYANTSNVIENVAYITYAPEAATLESGNGKYLIPYRSQTKEPYKEITVANMDYHRGISPPFKYHFMMKPFEYSGFLKEPYTYWKSMFEEWKDTAEGLAVKNNLPLRKDGIRFSSVEEYYTSPMHVGGLGIDKPLKPYTNYMYTFPAIIAILTNNFKGKRTQTRNSYQQAEYIFAFDMKKGRCREISENQTCLPSTNVFNNITGDFVSSNGSNPLQPDYQLNLNGNSFYGDEKNFQEKVFVRILRGTSNDGPLNKMRDVHFF